MLISMTVHCFNKISWRSCESSSARLSVSVMDVVLAEFNLYCNAYECFGVESELKLWLQLSLNDF